MILSIDFGTSSLKSALLDDNLMVVASSTIPYQYDIVNTDHVTLKASTLWSTLRDGVKSLDALGKVDLIVYDTFSPSVVFMDDEGTALYPVITHLDRRAKLQSRQIQKEIGAKPFQQITGLLPFTGGASVTTMMWMAQNMPEIYHQTAVIAHMTTWVYKNLTGIFAMDPVNATQTGAYETITGQGWSQSILTAVNLDSAKFPRVVEAGTILGSLTKAAAGWLGLTEGIPVAFGTNDAAVAQVGAGNNHIGEILNISGSSEMVSILTDVPIINEKYYLRRAAQKGLWQFYATTVGGFALDWMRNLMFSEVDANRYYNEIIPSLLAREPKKNSPCFLPYLAGDRQSLLKKRGSFNGMTLDTSREDLLLAVLNGINKPLVDTIELSAKLIKINPTVKITGGLTRIAGYCDLKARLFNVDNIQSVDDCTIRGSAQLALAMMNK